MSRQPYILFHSSATPLLTLYFLDSGAYIPNGIAWWKPLQYDYIRESQIDWFLGESNAIQTIERPFKPDGAKDLGKVWRRRGTGIRRMDLEERQASTGGSSSGGKKLAKPNAIMFFHIPMCVFQLEPNFRCFTNTSGGQKNDG